MDTKTLTDAIRYVALAIILMLAPRPAEAQDSLIKTKKQAELILPRPMLQPMKSMDLSGQVPMDTLSTADSTVKILLFADNTWKYIKDPSRAQNNTVFNEFWEHTLPNPYKVSDETLPSEIALWIVDSLGGYRCPNQTKVYSKFGYRHRRRHMGVDLPLNIGTPVYAAFDGRVRIAHRYKAYGNLVIIRHENGLETFYGHLSKIMVEEDEWVSAGSIIGLGGSTGRSTGPHLHFETRYKGYAFDPEWIVDFENGLLRTNVFVLRRSYLDPSSRYVPESIDEEEDIYSNDEKIIEEEMRIAAEKAAMKWHTVRSGDTVSGIAHKYGKSLSTIKKLNPGINLDKIRIGQKIRVN